jgi:hypothetical protein
MHAMSKRDEKPLPFKRHGVCPVSRTLLRQMLHVMKAHPGIDDASLKQRADAMASLPEPDWDVIADAEVRLILFAELKGNPHVWGTDYQPSVSELDAIARCPVMHIVGGGIQLDPDRFAGLSARPRPPGRPPRAD